MRALVLLLAALLLSGCLRVGPGEDLHLVCEEKSASPRKAYDIGFLVAQTRVEGSIEDKERVAMLEAARHHVISPGGRAHEGFRARLAPADAEDAWLFEGVGVVGERRPDVYEVFLWKDGATWSGSAVPRQRDVIRPPASVALPAWETANASREVQEALPEGAAARLASWQPTLPSCVRLAYANEEGARLEVVVNVVQSRVVYLARA
ncbi:MAG TPA: hypothetical protein VM582_03945 [Candidatus Thermoplasmatota archaeon]|nr:hypothetical protein [Candidatus Thermoplasmatota archaeon]